MPVGDESFSNPLAPPGETSADDRPMRLTNADFRKLLMTPRAQATTHKESASSTTPGTASVREGQSQRKDEKEDARAMERKKKKSYYARIKREEEEKMAELAEKYRDRAKERREGKNPDYQAEDPNQAAMGGYRAVAPDLKSGLDAAERRKQMIQESKFLGGDMEHTHLVKGLDYALLQKVRSEIQYKEAEEEMERTVPMPTKEKKVVIVPQPVVGPTNEEEEQVFKTNSGRRIFNAVFNSKPPEFNDLFLSGRMAYAIDLDDDAAESDIPTTVIRSKADLQGIENMQATFTTNDIVIQKLTQILSYLRTGRATKKQKKKEKGKNENAKGGADESIYGDIGDYVPSLNKATDRDRERDRERDRDHDRDRNKERNRDRDRGREREHRDRERDRDRRDRDRERGERDRERSDREREHDRERKTQRGSYFNRSAQEEVRQEMKAAEERLQASWPTGADVKVDNKAAPAQPQQPQQPPTLAQQLMPKSNKVREDDHYLECYPGMAEMQDAIDDSDDEADYTKMDMGNKKGPVGRWDFDTQEEYSDYMNQREAMPKAAFQYGVKMADGRKTRRIGKEKDKNAELNREWQQIQQILKRRKESEAAVVMDKRARYDNTYYG
ncbi:IC cytokine homolog beag [Oratosquilla oratoria]|uniref:IC cytokine homolog beag n=1 Tax=Oratosquilla oratoria TaxID=337810 RepID=UPI003F7752A5